MDIPVSCIIINPDRKPELGGELPRGVDSPKERAER
jgi:hypothetical protein